jgi:error-prone DNA polymerase
MGLDRRKALFEVYALKDRPEGFYTGQSAAAVAEQGISLPTMPLSEHVVHDYGSTSLSLKAHPVGFVREKLTSLNILTTEGLNDCQDGQRVKVSGLVLVRQRPGTAAGVCFITIEDETGVANLVVWASLFETYRKEILRATFLMVEGKLQREGEATHVIVTKCHDMSKMLKQLGEAQDNHRQLQTLSSADNNDGTFRDERKVGQSQLPYQGEIFGQGRNFK